MANNPSNFSGLGQFIAAFLNISKLSPAQLGWVVCLSLGTLNVIVLNFPLDVQVQFYRWFYVPILGLAFAAAKSPYPRDPDSATRKSDPDAPAQE